MFFKSLIRHSINQVLSKRGYALIPASLAYEWQTDPQPRGVPETPNGVTDDMVPGNSRLSALRDAYAAFGGPAIGPVVWTDDFVKPDHLRSFRGENGYVWQSRLRNDNPLGYALSYYYIKAHDPLRLLDKLTEDEAFGAVLFTADNRKISRDLLDSILELTFLERELGIVRKEGAVVLDVGAGYGRLAHRAARAFPNIATYLCTDAVAASTFLCERYMAYRGITERVRVVPLDQIEIAMAQTRIDVAVNIHSWSECHLDAVTWWVRLLARFRVPHVFIETNVTSPNRPMSTNRGEDLSRIMEEGGYQLAVREPKYGDPLVQAYGISPATYFLWKLRNEGASTQPAER